MPAMVLRAHASRPDSANRRPRAVGPGSLLRGQGQLRRRRARSRLRAGRRLVWTDDRRRGLPERTLRGEIAEERLEALGVDRLLGDELLGERVQLVAMRD